MNSHDVATVLKYSALCHRQRVRLPISPPLLSRQAAGVAPAQKGHAPFRNCHLPAPKGTPINFGYFPPADLTALTGYRRMKLGNV